MGSSKRSNEEDRKLDRSTKSQKSEKKAKKAKHETSDGKDARKEREGGNVSLVRTEDFATAETAESEDEKHRLRLKGVAANTSKEQIAEFLSIEEDSVKNVFHGEAIVVVHGRFLFERCMSKHEEKLNGRFVEVLDETNYLMNGGKVASASRYDQQQKREQQQQQQRVVGSGQKTTASEREGRDWTCAECKGENFARRDSCFKCGVERFGMSNNGDGNRNTTAHAPAIVNNYVNNNNNNNNKSGFVNNTTIDNPPPTTTINSKKQNNAGDRMVAQGSEAEGYEVFVKYLPKNVDEADIKDFFKKCGELKENVNLLRDQATGRSKGAGFLTFRDAQSREKALQMDGERFLDRTVSITVAKKSPFGTRGTTQVLGTHTPAMLSEVIESLGIENDRNGVYIDGTFGRGGHTRGILNALGENGQLHAFDLDSEAVEVGRVLEKEDSRFHMHHAPFGSMFEVMRKNEKIGNISGVFLDLGISSPQFDNKSRGFRPEQDGPLDLRFDITNGLSAYNFLLKVSRNELKEILIKYGETTDERSAQRISDAIVLARDNSELPQTTKAFASLVANAKGAEYQAMHPAKMTFQALRIHLNKEFDEFLRGMEGAMKLLKDNGKLGVLTWKHSECAILIEYYRQVETLRTDAPIFEWLKTNHEKLAKKLSTTAADESSNDSWAAQMDDCKRPTALEMQTNSRSRSAILHVLSKKCKAARMIDAEKVAYKKLKWDDAPLN